MRSSQTVGQFTLKPKAAIQNDEAVSRESRTFTGPKAPPRV